MIALSVLRLRDFRLLLVTRMMVAMAMQSQALIVGWQIYTLTHSPFILGLTGLAEALPAIGCALVAGHIVDNSRPYRVFVMCIGTLMLNMFLLMLSGGGFLALAPHFMIIALFFGVFVSGLARSFLMPSSFSLLPRVAPRDQIPSASAWLSGGFQCGIIIGPALAGIIFGGYGARIAWLLPVTLMTIAFICASALSDTHRQFRSDNKREPVVKSIKAGWRFIWQEKMLFSVMALDMFAVLFGGVTAMLPAFADQVLHTNSQGLGMLRAAPAIGAIFTTLFMALRPMRTINGGLLLCMVAGFGCSILGFSFSNTLIVSMLFLVLSGACDSVSMIMRQTIVQWLTPDAMRGRVSSVASMFIISSNEIGAFESGTAAHLLGLVPSMIFGGLATLFVVGTTAGLNPGLRKLELKPSDK